MRKEYDSIEIKVIYLCATDILTESGDNFEDDPWGSDFDY